MMKQKKVGVIGAGNFGTVVANLLAKNNEKVYLYARNPDVAAEIKDTRVSKGKKLKDNVHPVSALQEVAEECKLLFPVVPSTFFREMMKNLAVYIEPDHILIHGTKGLDLSLDSNINLEDVTELSRDQVYTMSEVMLQESVSLQVGCLAGPNLSDEIALELPAATVIASRFNAVILSGSSALRSSNFQVYGSNDIIGIELAGVLKNIIAIASGGLMALKLGENARGLLISRGLAEITKIGTAMGASPQSFLGVAGIGDLVATCSSLNSRNFSLGYRIALGETLEEIMTDAQEVAEGVNTIRLTKLLSAYYNIPSPLITTLYKILFENLSALDGLKNLMAYRMIKDVDFI